MTGPERVPRSATRHNPFGGIVFEHNFVPGIQKSGKKSQNAKQPPRPQNAWILYRAWALSTLLERQPELKGTPQSQISKILASQWANEAPEIRKHFEHQANLSKEQHAQEFPDYVYKPQKKEDKEKEREKRKQERARAREEEKMRKEVEKSLHGAVFPAIYTAPMPMPMPFGSALDSPDSPIPPLSQCPSPKTRRTADDDSDFEEQRNESDTSIPVVNLQETGASAYCTPISNVLEFASDMPMDSTNEQSAPVLTSTHASAQPDNLTASDASGASCSYSDVPFDWSRIPSSTMNDIDAFIRQAFPPGVPGPEPNRFEMPSGNIIMSPGFVEGEPLSGFDISGFVGIPLGNMPGIVDDQFDCDLANPHAEQNSSSSNPGSTNQSSNEAIYMQPFMQLDVSLDHLLSADKEVGDALLDEQEACANGERIIAAEHIQDGAPAASVSKPTATSFLPSPPESSSSTTSPVGLGPFDYGNATNLSASGSNKHIFGNSGFSDPMSNLDMSSTSWSLPTFNDFGQHNILGFEASNSSSINTTKLSTNSDDWRSSFQGGPFPPTPVSAGPWMGGGFDLGEITTGTFSSTTNVSRSSTSDVQAQKEDSWLASYFDESAGPI